MIYASQRLANDKLGNVSRDYLYYEHLVTWFIRILWFDEARRWFNIVAADEGYRHDSLDNSTASIVTFQQNSHCYNKIPLLDKYLEEFTIQLINTNEFSQYKWTMLLEWLLQFHCRSTVSMCYIPQKNRKHSMDIELCLAFAHSIYYFMLVHYM